MVKKSPKVKIVKQDIEELKGIMTGQAEPEKKEATIFFDKTQFTVRIPKDFAKGLRLRGGEKLRFTYLPDKKPRLIAELVE